MRCKAGMFSRRFSAYVLSNSSFVQSLDIGARESIPTGIAFSTDGLKMFIVGTSGDDVNLFELSSPWDISAASFVSVKAVQANPQGIAFSPDGLKMFIAGNAIDSVEEYSLSTPWDSSTASLSHTFSVAAQDGNPSGLTFSSDGTRMYIAGIDGDDINEYSLATAWDVSTATYTQNLNVNAEEQIVNGVAFSDDGLKMFVVGIASDAVNEYSLSTAWDISTASFANSFSVAAEDTAPRDLAFSSDGLKMFIIGDANNKVYEYSLT